MKLISITDFVLEQGLPHNTDSQFADKVIAYAHFLKQPLTLGMFVPCDEDGNVLKEPIYTSESNKFYNESYCKKYQQAKERVLFENVSLQHAKWLVNTYTLIEHITFIQTSMVPIYLTQSAIKQIGL